MVPRKNKRSRCQKLTFANELISNQNIIIESNIISSKGMIFLDLMIIFYLMYSQLTISCVSNEQVLNISD